MKGFMPNVIVKNITPGSNDPAIIPVGVILHVAVSMSDSLHDYFAHRSGGLESHFYVRLDGTIEQYRSIYFEADAQFAGNSFVIDGNRQGFVSVETEGMGLGTWTKAQIESIKRIIEFVHSERAFPWRVCPEWNKAGVGYHSLFPEWNETAHSCPGPDRIDQFRNIIAPWVKRHHKTVVHLSNLDSLGKRNVDVLRVKRRLKRRGFFRGQLTKFFGPGLRGSYRRWQKHLGYSGKDANGIPGKTSLEKLGFRVLP